MSETPRWDMMVINDNGHHGKREVIHINGADVDVVARWMRCSADRVLALKNGMHTWGFASRRVYLDRHKEK